jgi:hypothetical protein
MATLDLLKEKLTNMIDLTTDIGVGAFKSLHVIRDYEEAKIIDINSLKSQCSLIQNEHLGVTHDTVSDFDRKMERNELINQIILEFDKMLEAPVEEPTE